MALDNAQFISELSINDPPGTDAVAEGDDHIRTTKRATQQSFPNVDAAVPQTAAQMAQMAIKTEVNVFTQSNTFESILTVFSNGLRSLAQNSADVAGPIMQAEGGITRWQMFRAATDDGGDFELRRLNTSGIFQDTPFKVFAANGFMDFDTGAAQFPARSLRLVTGLTAPSVSVDTGMLFIGGAATLRWEMTRASDNDGGDLEFERFDANGTLQSRPLVLDSSDGTLKASSGTAAAPQYSFQSSETMGMYRLAGGILGFTVNGTDLFRLSVSATDLFGTNARIRASDSPAGSSEFEAGILTDTSGFVQMRTAAGVVSSVFRADIGALSYTGVSNSGKFGVGTASPARTLDVRGAQGTTPLRVLNLPTSLVGLASGDCWNNNNFMAIVP